MAEAKMRREKPMYQKTRIQLKENWDPNGYDFAISSAGNHIAVKYVNHESYDHSPPNVFVYDILGKEIFSFVNSHGGEHGIAFWPDDRHIITSGCGHPQNWNADGIKQWALGNNKFRHLFSDTHLTGTLVDLLGVTNRGRYIMGHRKKNWLIDTHNNNEIELPIKQIDAVIDRTIFSLDERFAGIAKDIFFKLGGGGIIIENSSGRTLWNKSGEYVLAFHPNSEKFLTIDSSKLIFRKLPNGDKSQEFSLESFGELTGGVRAAAYSKDGKILAVGSIDDKHVLIFNTDGMRLKNKITHVTQ
jgi:WD40 repeat protein